MKPKSIRTAPLPRGISLLANSTAAILLATGTPLYAADITWDDQAGDDLWSNPTNFNPDGDPAADNITFGSIGASPTAGTVTSIVDTNLTIGTLRFNNALATDTHTLQINDGVTLTSAPGTTLNTLQIGGGNTVGSVVTTAIRGQTLGQGSLTLSNPTGNMSVGFASGDGTPSTGILDMSGLGTFTANLAQLRIAATTGSLTSNSIGQVTLADSNTITADVIAVGGSGSHSTTGTFLRLGASNTLNADLIFVGNSRTSATMEFRSGLIAPTVTIGGKGAGTRADLIIADQASSRGLVTTFNGGSSEITGVVNFQGGTVNAMLDELVVGWGGGSSSNDGAGDGTLSFNAGTINALTVHVGRMANHAADPDNSTNNSVSDGILNVSGTGTLLANSILMGLNDDTQTGNRQESAGTLNVSGSATVTTTGDITLTQRTGNSNRTGTGSLNITGGTVTVGGDLVEGTAVAGTGANTSTVTLNGGTLDMTGRKIAVDAFNAQSGTLRNVKQLTNAATSPVALNKTTAGMLILAGTNTYTGGTTVTEGTLSIHTNGNLANGSTVTIQPGAILDLNFSGSDSVFELKFGAIAQANGKWGRIGSTVSLGADFESAQITGDGLLNVVPVVLTPYDQWALSKGLTGGPGSATDPAMTADPDQDGSTNLAEFAFNGNPTSGADNGQVYVLTADTDADAANELVLTLAVRKTTPAFAAGAPATATSVSDAISYSIEGSTTLADFLGSVTPVALVNPGVPLTDATNYEYRSFSLAGSNGLSGKGFLRAKVTTP